MDPGGASRLKASLDIARFDYYQLVIGFYDGRLCEEAHLMFRSTTDPSE